MGESSKSNEPARETTTTTTALGPVVMSQDDDTMGGGSIAAIIILVIVALLAIIFLLRRRAGQQRDSVDLNNAQTKANTNETANSIFLGGPTDINRENPAYAQAVAGGGGGGGPIYGTAAPGRGTLVNGIYETAVLDRFPGRGTLVNDVYADVGPATPGTIIYDTAGQPLYDTAGEPLYDTAQIGQTGYAVAAAGRTASDLTASAGSLLSRGGAFPNANYGEVDYDTAAQLYHQTNYETATARRTASNASGLGASGASLAFPGGRAGAVQNGAYVVAAAAPARVSLATNTTYQTVAPGGAAPIPAPRRSAAPKPAPRSVVVDLGSDYLSSTASSLRRGSVEQSPPPVVVPEATTYRDGSGAFVASRSLTRSFQEPPQVLGASGGRRPRASSVGVAGRLRTSSVGQAMGAMASEV